MKAFRVFLFVIFAFAQQTDENIPCGNGKDECSGHGYFSDQTAEDGCSNVCTCDSGWSGDDCSFSEGSEQSPPTGSPSPNPTEEEVEVSEANDVTAEPTEATSESPSSPQANPDSCESGELVEGTTLQYNALEHGDVVTLLCPEGWLGNVQIQCLHGSPTVAYGTCVMDLFYDPEAPETTREPTGVVVQNIVQAREKTALISNVFFISVAACGFVCLMCFFAAHWFGGRKVKFRHHERVKSDDEDDWVRPVSVLTSKPDSKPKQIVVPMEEIEREVSASFGDARNLPSCMRSESRSRAPPSSTYTASLYPSAVHARNVSSNPSLSSYHSVTPSLQQPSVSHQQRRRALAHDHSPNKDVTIIYSPLKNALKAEDRNNKKKNMERFLSPVGEAEEESVSEESSEVGLYVYGYPVPNESTAKDAGETPQGPQPVRSREGRKSAYSCSDEGSSTFSPMPQRRFRVSMSGSNSKWAPKQDHAVSVSSPDKMLDQPKLYSNQDVKRHCEDGARATGCTGIDKQYLHTNTSNSNSPSPSFSPFHRRDYRRDRLFEGRRHIRRVVPRSVLAKMV